MSRAFRQNTTQKNTYYPQLLGTHGAVATEHYLATKAGVDLLGVGGNAVDAAVGEVYAWNSRKRMFTDEQIRLAWDVLNSQGWLSSEVGS